jgi:predicted aspartyl protease
VRIPYDVRHEPAAPVIPILVGPPGRPEPHISLQALVDTGSDLSGIAISVLRHMGVKPVDSASTVDFDGFRSENPLYIVSIKVGGVYLSHVLILGIRADEPFLGRNVLNELDLNLNGPERRLTLY